MTDEARNNAPKTRGRPFEKGNPGRPRGSRHKATIAAAVLLDGEAEKLSRKAVELALAGDVLALRLCLERILPPRKDRPVTFSIPAINSAKDAAALMGALLSAVAEGAVTPDEAERVTRIVDAYVRTLETADLESRLEALERAWEGDESDNQAPAATA
jgi:hypothetical protein